MVATSTLDKLGLLMEDVMRRAESQITALKISCLDK